MKKHLKSWHFILLLLIALTARLLFSYLTLNHPSYGLATLERTSTLYPAYALAWGKGYVLPTGESNLGEAIRMVEAGKSVSPEAVHGPFIAQTTNPPGNAVIGAFLHRLTGKPVTILFLLFGSIIGTFAVGLVYLISFQVTQEARISFLVSFLYAVFPPSIRIYTSLSLLGPASFLVLLSVWLFLLSMKGKSVSWGLIGVSAVPLGLIAYFRPDWMLLAPCFTFGWLLSTLVLRQIPFRRLVVRAMIQLAILIAVQCIVMLPLAFKNQQATGQFRFTSSNAGWGLINGLGQYPNPWGIDGSDVARHKEALEMGFSGAGSPEADRYFKQKFLESIRQHPGAYVKILARRMVFVATPYQWGNEVRGHISDPNSFVAQRAEKGLLRALPSAVKEIWTQLISAFLMLLALPGMVFFCMNKEYFCRGAPVLILVFLYGLLIHVVIHIEARYLLPGVFVQLLGIAYLLNCALFRGKCRDRQKKGYA